MISLKNKKAKESEMFETILFIIITAVLFAMCFYYISWVGNTNSVFEEQYAKKIALTIDKMNPGSQETMYISKLFELAEKNNYIGPQDNVVLPIQNGKVTVRTSKKTGYSFYTFSTIKPEITIDKVSKTLTIKT